MGILLERCFHPIGQGAFYTEKFFDFDRDRNNFFNVVYDCGTETSQKTIVSEIKSCFTFKEQIDAVFISHFHNDHVNGLKYLIDYCDVKNIFLPLLTEEEKIEALLHNAIYSRNNVFIQNLISAQDVNRIPDFKGKVYFIGYEDERFSDEGSSFRLDDNRFNRENSSKKNGQKEPILKSGTEITTCLGNEWTFSPFNYKARDKSTLLIKELNDRGISLESADDFKKMWKDIKTQKKLRNAYKNLNRELNSNSMTLYSGPKHEPFYMNYIKKGSFYYKHWMDYESSLSFLRFLHLYDNYLPYYYREYFKCPFLEIIDDVPCFLNRWNKIKDQPPLGCLYLGDYDANNWEELNNKYKNYWGKIGMIQVPHHGSPHNYNFKLNKKEADIFIISAGGNNKYGHPDPSIFNSLLNDRKFPFLISENKNSEIRILGEF